MVKIIAVTEGETLGEMNYVAMVYMELGMTERKAVGEVHIRHGRGGRSYYQDHHG
jgi:hypothetical protein